MEQSLSLPAGAAHWMKGDASAKSELISDLRPLTLADEPRFRAAVEVEQPMSWLYYFPFLYCFAQNRRQTLLWEEVGGSICLYLLKRQGDRNRLALYVTPFPYSTSALAAAQQRVVSFNGDDSFRVAWVEERYADAFLSNGFRLRHREDEFIYDTAKVLALEGKEFSGLRRHINKGERIDGISIRPLEATDQEACYSLFESWHHQLTTEMNLEFYGYHYLVACLKSVTAFSQNSLFGLVTLVRENIVGVMLGGPIHSKMGSIFVTFSDHRIEGLGYLQRFALMKQFPDLRYFNDSSDAGRTGLVQLKRQFRPILMNPLSQALT